MTRHADLLAVFEHWTRRALSSLAGADMFAERAEETVALDPVTLRKDLLERGHCLCGRARRNDTPAIGHAVDVDVDADARLAAGDAECEVRAFGSHAFERRQGVEVARQLAVEFLDGASRD